MRRRCLGWCGTGSTRGTPTTGRASGRSTPRAPPTRTCPRASPPKGPAQGPEGVAGFAEEFANNPVGGLVWELRGASRKGGRATAEWSFSGTNEGLVSGEGTAGKAFAVRGSTAYELEGEKIRRSSDYYDHPTIMRQVGALPEVGAPPS